MCVNGVAELSVKYVEKNVFLNYMIIIKAGAIYLR